MLLTNFFCSNSSHNLRTFKNWHQLLNGNKKFGWGSAHSWPRVVIYWKIIFYWRMVLVLWTHIYIQNCTQMWSLLENNTKSHELIWADATILYSRTKLWSVCRLSHYRCTNYSDLAHNQLPTPEYFCWQSGRIYMGLSTCKYVLKNHHCNYTRLVITET